MKKLNLKQKIHDFIIGYKAETEIIRHCNSRTPLHRKVSRIISIILCVLWLIIWLCSFPSSAADEPIEPVQGYINGNYYVRSQGQYWNLGQSSFTITEDVLFTCPYVDRTFHSITLSNSYDEVTGSYHASVFYDDLFVMGRDPESGWFVYMPYPHPLGYISFIGDNLVSDTFLSEFFSLYGFYNDEFPPEYPNGPFPPSVPDPPMSYTIEEGVYIFDTDHEIFDMEGLTFTYPIPFYDLVYRTFDTLTIHSGYYENGHSYVDIYYDDTRVYKWETLTEPFLSQRGRMIYVTEDTEIAIQGAEAFETYYNYIPLMDYTDFDHCCLTFQFGFDAGFTDGKDVGYNDGYYDGYAEGYDSHGNAGVFGNFFDLVYEALDNIPVYESPDGVVSIIDVIQTILGGFILLFILKLIAGG